MDATNPALEPDRTALLVMDYQPAVLAMLIHRPDPAPLLSRVQDAISHVRAHGGTIAYCRVAFNDDDYAAIPTISKAFAPAARHRMMRQDDPATAIHDSLTPQTGDIVVRKTRYSAMSTTDLDQQLRDRGINTLILAGISTSGVVLSTIVDAADRDYRLYVLSDGIDDSDRESHDVLVRKVIPRRADVIDTAELRTLLQTG